MSARRHEWPGTDMTLHWERMGYRAYQPGADSWCRARLATAKTGNRKREFQGGPAPADWSGMANQSLKAEPIVISLRKGRWVRRSAGIMQLIPQPMKNFVDLRRISPDGYAPASRNQLHQEKLLFKCETRLFEVRQHVFECSHSPSPLQRL